MAVALLWAATTLAVLCGAARNVVYVISDDMRVDWGAYGQSAVHTPNLDELVAGGLLFERAYCQLSVCAPSRMSFMSSRRPDTYKVWNFIDTIPTTVTSLPRHFRDNNFLTLGLGKTWHQDSGAWNAANCWSQDKPYYPYQGGSCPHGNEGGGHCVKPESEIYDYHLLNKTFDYIRYAVKSNRPFFLMTGFRKPHAPWETTQAMYDLYNVSEIPTPANDVAPENMPLIAWSRQLAVKLENGTSFPYGPYNPVPKWVQQDQRRAYYAAVSSVDDHVGRIVSLLKELNVEQDTAIVFHADHGYHLGEHGEWEKKSNFDLVVRVPLAIRIPWLKKSLGKRTTSLTELVDVYPTLSSLLGLPPPVGVDGEDLSSLFHDPTQSLKQAAYHQYPACGVSNWNETRQGCNNAPKNKFTHMGYTVRTNDWRYTAWFHWDGDALVPKWNEDYRAELYDHTGDQGRELDKFENVNLAYNPKYNHTATVLHAQLLAFFKKH